MHKEIILSEIIDLLKDRIRRERKNNNPGFINYIHKSVKSILNARDISTKEPFDNIIAVLDQQRHRKDELKGQLHEKEIIIQALKDENMRLALKLGIVGEAADALIRERNRRFKYALSCAKMLIDKSKRRRAVKYLRRLSYKTKLEVNNAYIRQVEIKRTLSDD